jgi:uncharacterized membrane protein YkvA (DUF1232 family)
MKNTFKALLVIGLTLLYLVSPLDLVPDFLPGVGQLDDLVALFFGGKKAISLLKSG